MSAVLQSRLELLPMQTSDLHAVMTIENDVYPFPWTEGNFRDALKAGYSGWIFRAGGVTIGYAMLMLVVDEVHLLNISIARACHGQGYGASLLRHAMDVARHGGADTMLLEVRPSNLPALKLYENFGFVQVGTRRGYYPAVNGREDAIVLRRQLGEVCA